MKDYDGKKEQQKNILNATRDVTSSTFGNFTREAVRMAESELAGQVPNAHVEFSNELSVGRNDSNRRVPKRKNNKKQ